MHCVAWHGQVQQARVEELRLKDEELEQVRRELEELALKSGDHDRIVCALRQQVVALEAEVAKAQRRSTHTNVLGSAC